MIAYHFVGSTLRDGRPVPPDGVWLEHDGPIAIRESGLHASRRPWHALQFAPGETLCLVEVADIVEEERNKLVARRRRIVRRVDLTADLRAFTLQCARDVLHLWDAPDVVRRYLETGDETLRAAAWAATWADEEADAWIAARNAAWEAAWEAARDAALADEMAYARTAAWCAARNAVKAAAWGAAWTAAWRAADYAAQAAAWADEMAHTRVSTRAARNAAWTAAWDAALDAQGARFDALCRARLGVTEEDTSYD